MNLGLPLTIIAAIALAAAVMFIIEEMKVISDELSDIKWRLTILETNDTRYEMKIDDKTLQIVELENRIKKLEENNK